MPSGFSRNLGGPDAFGTGQAGHFQPHPLYATAMPTSIALNYMKKIGISMRPNRVETLQLWPGGIRKGSELPTGPLAFGRQKPPATG
jgi:hypothetical protein